MIGDYTKILTSGDERRISKLIPSVFEEAETVEDLQRIYRGLKTNIEKEGMIKIMLSNGWSMENLHRRKRPADRIINYSSTSRKLDLPEFAEEVCKNLKTSINVEMKKIFG